ncbi:hypothetical protein N7478_003212 [Penicillium angulare]|uniref:uncharacterized protein n=1 Tax=Penicillium angulare TaxID=116970 RepID=UPI0025412419|nr:uncharacterized protein N7478_003212 [Penicillium angulare]KAJ5287526.1 hypothetical protein N7478_003212 [Penicillium angulare]
MTKEDFIQEFEKSDEFKLLDKVVNEEITMQDAFFHLLKLTMDQLSIYGPEDWNKFGTPDYNVACATVELAQRLEPSKHSKLVEFMYHLQKQVAIYPSTNEPLDAQGHIFWTELPSFGYTEFEEWEEFGGAHEDPFNPRMYYKERDRWTKLNAFLAQLTQAADVYYPSSQKEPLYHPLDRSGRAIWTIAMALEKDRPPAWLRNIVLHNHALLKTL